MSKKSHSRGYFCLVTALHMSGRTLAQTHFLRDTNHKSLLLGCNYLIKRDWMRMATFKQKLK